MSPTFKLSFSLAATASLVALFSASGARSAEAEGPRRGPPPEAIEACAELEQGDACSVTFEERSVEGTCEETREGELACRPERGSDHRAPPPEAIEACSGAAEGASCSVTFGEHSVEGSCERIDDEQLACRPSGLRRASLEPHGAEPAYPRPPMRAERVRGALSGTGARSRAPAARGSVAFCP